MRYLFPVFSLVVSTSVHAGVLNDCYDRADTRPAVSQCLSQRLDTAQQEHTALASAALNEARSLDGVTDGRHRAVQRFQQAESAFNQYRQDFCSYTQALLASGNGAEQAALACLIDLTEAHTQRLRNR